MQTKKEANKVLSKCNVLACVLICVYMYLNVEMCVRASKRAVISVLKDNHFEIHSPATALQ